jgi:hypothetical protein
METSTSETVSTVSREFPIKIWRMLKEDPLQFYDKAIKFLMDEDHMWCRYPEVMNEMVILFEKVTFVPIQQILRRMHRQLRLCQLWFDIKF